MVFKATFSNISVILMWYRVEHAMTGIQTNNLGGDCTGSCKSSYHTIMTTTEPEGGLK